MHALLPPTTRCLDTHNFLAQLDDTQSQLGDHQEPVDMVVSHGEYPHWLRLVHTSSEHLPVHAHDTGVTQGKSGMSGESV